MPDRTLDERARTAGPRAVSTGAASRGSASGDTARRRAARQPAAELPVASVAVEISLPHLDRPFDYLVPAALADVAVPGCRVRVRFAGRLTGGFLLARTRAQRASGPARLPGAGGVGRACAHTGARRPGPGGGRPVRRHHWPTCYGWRSRPGMLALAQPGLAQAGDAGTAPETDAVAPALQRPACVQLRCRALRPDRARPDLRASSAHRGSGTVTGTGRRS